MAQIDQVIITNPDNPPVEVATQNSAIVPRKQTVNRPIQIVRHYPNDAIEMFKHRLNEPIESQFAGMAVRHQQVSQFYCHSHHLII